MSFAAGWLLPSVRADITASIGGGGPVLRSVRDLILAIYAIMWAFTVGITVWRTNTVPAELLAALGIGVGGILGAFKLDDRGRRPAEPPERRELEETPS